MPTFRRYGLFRGPEDLWEGVPLTGLVASFWSDYGPTVTSLGAVSSWPDVSGSGLAAVQATAANQPAFTAGGQNGYPKITFTGTQILTCLTGNIIATGAARTVFAVGAAAATSGGGCAITFKTSAVVAAFEYGSIGLAAGVYTDGSAVNANITGSPALITNPQIFEWDYTVGSAIGFSLNGAAQAITMSGGGLVATSDTGVTGFSLGNRADAGSGVFNGDLYAIMVYDTTKLVSAAAVRKALGNKYGIVTT